MKYDFIEIGTSDFDTLIQTCKNERGLSIEPLKFYQDRLPNKPNVKKINSAISDEVGEMPIFYIHENDIKKYKLPDWIRGCNSVGTLHQSLDGKVKWVDDILKRCLKPFNLQVKDIVRKEMVSVINWETLVKNENISSIDVLKIDTEGHDIIILNDYLKNCVNNTNLYAKKIQFESNQLISEMEVDNMISKLESIGYKLIERGHETILSYEKI